MTQSPYFRLLLLCGIAATFSYLPARADVLYSEYFDSPALTSGQTRELSDYGWQVHRGSDGALAGADVWTDPLNNSQGRQARVVNDAGAPSSPNRVYYFSSGDDFLAWSGTEITGINIASYNDLTLSFDQRDDAGGTNARAVVQVDTQWYAWGTPTSTTSWATTSADFATANWHTFTFDGTTTTNAASFNAVNGTGVALTSGSVQAVGIYSELVNAQSMRYDSIELSGTVIPEPSTLLLVGGALAALLVFRRRK